MWILKDNPSYCQALSWGKYKNYNLIIIVFDIHLVTLVFSYHNSIDETQVKFLHTQMTEGNW